MRKQVLENKLSILVLQIVVMGFLFAGCRHASFLAMDQNYGITLPDHCEVIGAASVTIGPDSIRIHKLQYEEDIISDLFHWKEYDRTVQEDLDRMFHELAECEKRDPSIQASGLINEISEELPKLLYHCISRSSGIVCYLLLDPDNYILYVCEANY